MKLMTLTVLAYGRPMGIHTRQANLDKWRPRLCRAICISFGGGQGRNGGLNRGMDGRDQTVEVFGVRGLSRWRCLLLWMCVHRRRAPLGPAWWCCQIKGWGAEGLMADLRHMCTIFWGCEYVCNYCIWSLGKHHCRKRNLQEGKWWAVFELHHANTCDVAWWLPGYLVKTYCTARLYRTKSIWPLCVTLTFCHAALTSRVSLLFICWRRAKVINSGGFNIPSDM